MGTPGGRIAIVGVGYSTVARRTGLTERQLIAQAGTAALADAGLTGDDINGVATMGGEALDTAQMLGCNPVTWFSNAGLGPAFIYPALQAIAGIKAGFCDTCIAFRALTHDLSTPAAVAAASGRSIATDDAQFKAPFGFLTGVHWAGLFKQRYMHEYGVTEEQFGNFAVAQREHAVRNDDALLRSPLSLDEYLASRYVSEPLRILDCDYPCDSGAAVIFTTEERARDLRQRPVFVDAYALAGINNMNFELLDDMVRTAPVTAAQQLWERSSYTVDDVDCAQLYDGFTIMTFQWIEALGFCGRGEAGAFVSDGNTRLRGRVPINTDGGACNVGRRHGANFCIEATRQLRGTCGDRQVDDARVAVFTTGTGPFAGAVLLTNE